MRHVPLTVVHVVAALPVAASVLTWPVGHVPEEVLEVEENEARNILADAVHAAGESVGGADRLEINSERYLGSTVSVLAELSKEAQMVVVAWRGRTGHRRLLGPVSTGLIHHARVPVAVVHDEVEPQELTQLPVLVGIDGSPASELATELAFDEASWRAVGLVALHVWSDADMSSIPSPEWSSRQRVAEKTLAESLAGWQEKYPEVPVTRVVEYDNPARRLLDHAQRAQLVTVGSHGRGGFAGMMLGSISTVVVQEARVPVLVARRH